MIAFFTFVIVLTLSQNQGPETSFKKLFQKEMKALIIVLNFGDQRQCLLF